MANILPLATNFYETRVAAKRTQEGKELARLKDEFKAAFTSYLNWGGKYEAIPIEVKNFDNKAARKTNEWALQRQRLEAAAPMVQKVINTILNVLRKFLSCFYTPSFPIEKQQAYQDFYARTHLGNEPGQLAVQDARAAKHEFKDAFLPLDTAGRAEFKSCLNAAGRKGDYWAWKAAQRVTS